MEVLIYCALFNEPIIFGWFKIRRHTRSIPALFSLSRWMNLSHILVFVSERFWKCIFISFLFHWLSCFKVNQIFDICMVNMFPNIVISSLFRTFLFQYWCSRQLWQGDILFQLLKWTSKRTTFDRKIFVEFFNSICCLPS